MFSADMASGMEQQLLVVQQLSLLLFQFGPCVVLPREIVDFGSIDNPPLGAALIAA